uniref:Uncharacterized protein n=1 Tax=Opuntia streptacantha TaxID=393608 RepID=A0A7C9AIS6_OPUST
MPRWLNWSPRWRTIGKIAHFLTPRNRTSRRSKFLLTFMLLIPFPPTTKPSFLFMFRLHIFIPIAIMNRNLPRLMTTVTMPNKSITATIIGPIIWIHLKSGFKLLSFLLSQNLIEFIAVCFIFIARREKLIIRNGPWYPPGFDADNHIVHLIYLSFPGTNHF